jgi:hypothetical protein
VREIPSLLDQFSGDLSCGGSVGRQAVGVSEFEEIAMFNDESETCCIGRDAKGGEHSKLGMLFDGSEVE